MFHTSICTLQDEFQRYVPVKMLFDLNLTTILWCPPPFPQPVSKQKSGNIKRTYSKLNNVAGRRNQLWTAPIPPGTSVGTVTAFPAPGVSISVCSVKVSGWYFIYERTTKPLDGETWHLFYLYVAFENVCCFGDKMTIPQIFSIFYFFRIFLFNFLFVSKSSIFFSKHRKLQTTSGSWKHENEVKGAKFFTEYAWELRKILRDTLAFKRLYFSWWPAKWAQTNKVPFFWKDSWQVCDLCWFLPKKNRPFCSMFLPMQC